MKKQEARRKNRTVASEKQEAKRMTGEGSSSLLLDSCFIGRKRRSKKDELFVLLYS
jgi:hypothetical protein